MRYKILGKSGLRVSELCLGAMTFGEKPPTGASKEESKRIFDAFIKAGGNFIDTSNRYSFGKSETILGDFIHSERENIVLATKYTRSMSLGNPNSAGSHRKNLIHSLESSLKRLKTDFFDIYWVHIWDPFTPIQETMRALDDMVRMGKILYIGISNSPAWIISRANTMAELSGWSQFIGIQIQYSLVTRDAERCLLPMSKDMGIGVLSWGTLGSGVLTGKYNKKEKKGSGRAELLDQLSIEKIEIASHVVNVAKEIQRLPSQVAINWVRQQPFGIIPLIGVRSVDQLKMNLDCLEFKLSDSHLEYLNNCSKIDLGYPHGFIVSEDTRKVVYGNSYELIDK